MKTVVDYEALSTPGLVIGTTDTLSAISIGIRAADKAVHTNLIEGIEAIASTKVPSHCFMTYTENDLLMGMELTYPNINKPDLGEVSINAFANHFVFVAKPPCIDDDDIQDNILKWLEAEYKLDIPYNVLGLFKFLDHDIPNSPNHMYCAQFASLYLQWLSNLTNSFKIPDEWKVGTKDWMVSPVQLMAWTKAQGWWIPWTKQVDDDYSQAEIIAPLSADV